MRIEGWEARLFNYLRDAQTSQFVWGQNDCALWAALWIKQCNGDDFTGQWLGKYKTAKGAKMRMTRLGFPTVADIANHHLTEKPVKLAQRGDLVFYPFDESTGALGICNGLKSHFLAEIGVQIINTSLCLRAWAV